MASVPARPPDWYVPGNGNSHHSGMGWRWFNGCNGSAIWMEWLEPDMEIKVQIIWEGRTITLKVNSKDTLATVKARIHRKEGRSSSMATEKARMQQYHPDQQLIMFPHYPWSPMEPRDGRQFNRRTLSDFNILKESTILLSVAGFIEVILHTGEIIKVDKV